MHFGVTRASRREAGYSMVELFVVLAILVILGAIAIPQLYHSRKLFKSEEQALLILDALRETSQMAITKRRTFRFEIDLTANVIRIIDERNPDPAITSTPTNSADLLVKKIPLERPQQLRVDVRPAGISRPNPPNYADAVFAADTTGHLDGTATVTGNNVWAGRFRADGSMVNSGNNPISVNLYVFPPTTSGNTNSRNKTEVRAITIFGGSGAVRYWKFSPTASPSPGALVPYQ